jgi:hypothetical protein
MTGKKVKEKQPAHFIESKQASSRLSAEALGAIEREAERQHSSALAQQSWSAREAKKKADEALDAVFLRLRQRQEEKERKNQELVAMIAPPLLFLISIVLLLLIVGWLFRGDSAALDFVLPVHLSKYGISS